MKFRLLVLAVAAGVLIVGIVRVGQTRVDALPEFGPTTVEVQTEALGLSAAEVEQMITVPLEQDLLVGIAFLDEIESVSLPGLSSVTMTFQEGTDVLAARQVVQERLTQAVGAAGLPAVASTPQMMQPHSSSSRATVVKLSSESQSLIDMSVLARWIIGPRLLGVDGVANVSIWGNRDRQLQVLVDPRQLRADGVRLSEVIRTAGNALEVSPLSYLEASKPGTGGFLDTANQRLNIFHEQSITTADELAGVPLEGRSTAGAGTDGPALLGDVSQVVEDHQPLIGDAVCQDGSQCLMLVIEKFPGTTNPEVTEGVEAAMDVLAPGLGDMAVDTSVYRPASYVDTATSNVGWALLAGAVLLLALLALFFWEWRRTVVVVAGMVVSLGTAFLVLSLRDTAINLMVAAGLVLGLTVLLADAVDDVHGIAARVRQFRRTGTSGPVWPTVLDAASELRRTALFAVLVVVAAAVPFFFLAGEPGAFLPPIAASYLLAVAASMLVALTVTPALAVMLLGSGSTRTATSPVVTGLHRAHDRVVPAVVGRGRTVLAAGVGLALIGLLALPLADWSMRPEVEERDLMVALEAPTGTSLPRMTAITEQAVAQLGSVAGVKAVNGQVGRAVMSDQTVDVDQADLWVGMEPDADYDATRAAVEEAAGTIDGAEAEVTTYSSARIGEVLGTDDGDLTVRVYGENRAVLEEKAAEIRDTVSGVDGISSAAVRETPQETTLQVTVDLAQAQAERIKPGDVRRAASVLVGGITVGNLFEEQKVFDVVVWGQPGVRATQADIENLIVDRPGGGHVRLGDVAEVAQATGPAVIRHESVAPFVEVTATVAGDLAGVTERVDAAVDEVAFPLDHHAEVLSASLERQEAGVQLVTITVAAMIAVFLLLQAAFRSWRLAALGFVALPMALSGGLLVALATGSGTLGTVAALLAVLALASRGMITLVREMLEAKRLVQEPAQQQAVLAASRDRAAPMLLTLTGAAALLLPMAVLGGPGLEVLNGAALVAIGALVSTAAVLLFVVPTAFLMFAPDDDSERWADELFSTPAPATEQDADRVRG